MKLIYKQTSQNQNALNQQAITNMHLDLFITNAIVSTKIYDKRNDFNFEIVNSHFLMAMFLALFLMVYTFCKLFGLQEYVLMLMTSTTETNC